MAGVIGADAGDDGGAVADGLDDGSQQASVLGHGRGGRFAGGAADDETVIALIDQVAGHSLRCVEVEIAVGGERRDHSGQHTPKRRSLSGERRRHGSRLPLGRRRPPTGRHLHTGAMNDDVYGTDLASVPRGDGVRDLVMTDRWNTPAGRPNGGYILATMLRGLREEIDASDPLVAAITYHSAPQNGPAEITARPVRLGRRIQTGDATLVQDDRLVAQVTASFGPRTEGRRVEFGTPPTLDPPDQYPDPRDHGIPSGGIFDRVDYRLARVPGFIFGTPSG